MKIAIILGTLLLSGCGSAPPVTQTVYVPLHTPCVKDVPARPDYEFDKLALDSSAGEKVLALARDWTSGRKYLELLEAVVAGCL
ncbi:UNVERIFIED_ORG: hypothetical protein JN05_01300 [Zoogloea ramigera]|uniref:Uncharacterized protein n=1 Tax=Duganella zoogloeoides TaxID=75659 RepID=A0ABZ0Y4T2_9BURK|nr:hypothetical protein [Duganella zoogloeoides]WQH06906.1 hypothetical protein SR858_11410 [Duganella zoogloeoides]